MSAGIWESIQDDLRAKIDTESYNAFIAKAEIEEKSNALILWVPTLFHKDWIDNHFRDGIASAATKHSGSAVSVKVLCRAEGIRPRERKEAPRPQRGKRARPAPGAEFLNELYTFDSFVVGTSNQFAHAACLAVAEVPLTYNPLFIYGGSGLGKTHLMHAIGHHVLKKRPETKVIYAMAEQFTNEFITALKDSRIDAFQRKYRGADLLLIDDIAFLANKERSQQEFFHTFNELYESKRQLVIASDRSPKEMPTIEDRLRSRLEWGLITDIQQPNLETRIAILRKKADEADIDIPHDCMEFIASRVKSNIRELEGALMRVGAMSSLMNKPITLAQTQDALRDLTEIQPDSRITIDSIQKAVAEYFKVTTQELKGKRRSSDVTLPRQVAMFLCREITRQSLPVIGTEFGGRDHTTVLHSTKKIADLLERDRHMQNIMNDIRSSLKG